MVDGATVALTIQGHSCQSAEPQRGVLVIGDYAVRVLDDDGEFIICLGWAPVTSSLVDGLQWELDGRLSPPAVYTICRPGF